MKISFIALWGATLLLTSPVYAQSFHCETISSGFVYGTYGSPVTATARLSSRPDLAGYQVTGGGCDFSSGGGASDGNSHVSTPIKDGYECVQSSVSNTFSRANAFAIACGIERSFDGVKAPFSNVGLGGNTVAIARSMQSTVPFSIRVCNQAGGQPIDVDLSDKASDTRRVGVNQCLDVDTPQRVFFRTPNTVDVDESGYYAIFERGTFSKTPSVGSPAKIDKTKRVTIGPFKLAVSNCQKPSADEPFDQKHYWGYCSLTQLTDKKNYRLCFDSGYSNQGKLLEYPGSLLPVVLDKGLMAQPPTNGQLDVYKYLVIEPNGCRDLFGVSDGGCPGRC